MTAVSRPLALVAALILAVGLLAGCGGSTTAGDATLTVVLKGAKVTDPNQAITVGVGKTLTLDITADAGGSLHVHSSPEQQVDFAAGHTVKRLVFKVPGVIEIEDHATEQLVAQVKVQ